MRKKSIKFLKAYYLLIIIFITALFIRFIYFPSNVHFDYDSARDSFIALDLLQGNLKLVGPPSWLDSRIHHGPLIYYTLAPIYLIFNQNPEVVSAALRIFNALGVFLVFIIGTTIFNKRIGLIASLLFAVSYEQSQYSLFFAHPALAVIPVLIFYLGLSRFIFLQKQHGLIIALLGLGLATQYHYANGLLLFVLLSALLFFHKSINFKIHYLFYSLATFLITVSTFILAEIKFNFPFSGAAYSQIQSFSKAQGASSVNFDHLVFIWNRFIHNNLLSWDQSYLTAFLLLSGASIYLILKNDLRREAIFILLWFLGGLLPHVLFNSTSYYYNPGASVGLLLIVSCIIYKLFQKFSPLALLLLLLIIFSNLITIINFNHRGPNKDIVIQPGMLLPDEKKVVDYIYGRAENKPFAVKSLTIPLNVNTTWSYLFEWYGRNKYGYLPTWIGPNAQGFPGHLEVEPARSKLPQKQFLIIEPTVGIRESFQDNFFREEGYFTRIVEEKHFGTFTVQIRNPY